MKKLTSNVKVDEYTEKITKAFDYEFTGECTFEVPELPFDELPEVYNIGLIVGSSGSGKSTLLKEFNTGLDKDIITWRKDVSVASNFKTPDEAIEKLGAVGLNSIPSWVKPFHVLSNGEQFRASLARRLEDYALIDEFTSVVDRNVAKACSASVSKYIRKKNLRKVVFASCHRDIIEWLEPDWVYDTDTKELSVGRNLWQRPEIKLDIYETNYQTWELFKKYHYLSANMNKACKCFVAYWGDIPVGFVGSLFLPGKIPPLYEGDDRKKYRESRLVILPDFQGLGLGNALSEAVAQMFLDQGFRYFCKTAHVRVGEHRQNSLLWRPTSTNLKSREKSQKCSKKDAWHHLLLDTKRLCFSHEYIGTENCKYRKLYENQQFSDKEDKRVDKQRKLFIKNKNKTLDN